MAKFRSGTSLMGATEPGQSVTSDNVGELPPGSVVRIVSVDDETQRLIHLHDGLWLWCSGCCWCYDRIENLKYRLTGRSVLCHMPVEKNGA
jgi:hypothetical protein